MSIHRKTAAQRRSASHFNLLRPSALTLAIGSLAFNLAQAQEAAPTVPTSPTSPLEQVIVTGTRAVGTKETQSVSPISVISADTLKKTGQNSVIDALIRLEPSFQAPARGGDVASIVRSATLRSLTANETLVLVNGKRRNTSAYISTATGASAVDLDLIPLSSVDHVEVLKDGAAAQYGSDAIAGVINIILKSGTDGTIQVDYGRFADSKVNPNNLGNGATKSAALDKGFKLGEDGFIHLGAEFRDHDHTNQTGPEIRRDATTGVPLYQGPYPFDRNVPAVNGDASYRLASGSYNANFKLNPDLEVYSFGTFAKRNAESLQNVRPVAVATASNCFVAPGSSTIIRTNKPGNPLSANCSNVSVSDLAKAYYPANYFIPIETLDEKNLALAGGIKGVVWNDARWDFSIGYGRDKMDIGVKNSLNYAYLLSTVAGQPAGGPAGTSQTSAYVGQYNNSQVVGNLDVSKPFVIGFLPEPLDVSVGLEARRDTYEVKQGDVQSWSNGGLQGFVGETPTDAGTHDRKAQAAYIELDTNLTPKWVASVAARYEHFSDSGSTRTGKISTRYDFTPEVALRGTYSNGFRAPTLAEQYFTTTTVGPTSATVVLPPGSSAAAIVGGTQLMPEKSRNLSLGLVLTPTKTTRFTLDAYQITISDRLVNVTGLNEGLGAPYGGTNGLVAQSIAARGVVIPATASGSGIAVQYFGNGVDEMVRGVDLTASTLTELGRFGEIRWTLASNFNQTKVTKVPAAYSGATTAGLTDGQPKDKVVLQSDYLIDKFTFTGRVTHYGAVSSLGVPTSTSVSATNPYIRTVNHAAFILDGEIGYQLLPELRLVVGGNNLTNRRPTVAPSDIVNGSTNPLLTAAARNTSQSNSTGAGLIPTLSPYGINGAYYYARAIYKF